MSQLNTEQAYDFCLRMASNHYENFPVASRMLPARLRKAIAVVYAFARTADDYADEGNINEEQRLSLLENYEQQLQAVASGNPVDDPVFIALADVITQFQLPLELFSDLLSAFKQDVTKKRYRNFGEVMDYCRRSANPVGRLLLYLHNEATPVNLALSDAICSALQLINFLQDIQQDFHEQQRIYMPEDEMQKYRVNEDHIRHAISDTPMYQLLQFQVERCRRLLESGAPLGKKLKGRFGLEIRLTIAGGARVLQKLHGLKDNLYLRPRLGKADYLWMLWHALRAR